MPDLSMESPHLASDTATVLTLGVAGAIASVAHRFGYYSPCGGRALRSIKGCNRNVSSNLRLVALLCRFLLTIQSVSQRSLLFFLAGVEFPFFWSRKKPAPEWVIEAVRLGAFGVLEQPLEKEPFRTTDALRCH